MLLPKLLLKKQGKNHLLDKEEMVSRRERNYVKINAYFETDVQPLFYLVTIFSDNLIHLCVRSL
jgi:hypothetical protein